MDTAHITDDAVLQAIERIRSAGPLANSPLLRMAAVTARLRSAGASDTAGARAWALGDLLADSVRAALVALGGAPDAGLRSRAAALAQVEADYLVDSPDREAWSAVWYRFLAAYPLHAQEIAAVARPGSPHGRKHIQRRTERGVGLLAGALRHLEQAAGPDTLTIPAIFTIPTPAERRRQLAEALALAEQAAPALTGPEQAQWIERLGRAHVGILDVLTWSAGDPETAVDGLRLAGWLAPYWQLSGRFAEGRAQLARLIEQAGPDAPPADRARALDGLGDLALQQGDFGAAKRWLEAALAAWRALGDAQGESTVLRRLGNVLDELGDYPGATARYDEALAVARSRGDDWSVAATLNNLGLVALRQGDYAAADLRLAESLAMFRAQGADWAVGVTQANLGDLAFDTGDPATAGARYGESLAIARRLEDQDGVAYALTGLANVARAGGDSAAARSHLAESLAVLHSLQDRHGVAEWLESAAALARADGRPAAAARLLGAADALRAAIGAPRAPKDRPTHEALASALCSYLGDEAFRAATAAGAALGWRRAADEALAGPAALE